MHMAVLPVVLDGDPNASILNPVHGTGHLLVATQGQAFSTFGTDFKRSIAEAHETMKVQQAPYSVLVAGLGEREFTCLLIACALT